MRCFLDIVLDRPALNCTGAGTQPERRLEILAAERLQLIADPGIIALPQDQGDHLVGIKRELPFLLHVIRQGGFRPDDQQLPLARRRRPEFTGETSARATGSQRSQIKPRNREP
jgi:hypothetical protein